MEITLRSDQSMYEIMESVRSLAENSGKNLIMLMDEGTEEFSTTEHVRDGSTLSSARYLIDLSQYQK